MLTYVPAASGGWAWAGSPSPYHAVGDYNDYNSTCSPECNPDDIDPVRTKFTLSYVSLGIGAAGLAGAGLVFALSRANDGSQTEARLVPTAGGAAATLRTTF